MDCTSKLEGGLRESASRGHPWFLLPARAVEQLGLVAVVCNAIIVPGSLICRCSESRASRLVTSPGGGQAHRRPRVVIQDCGPPGIGIPTSSAKVIQSITKGNKSLKSGRLPKASTSRLTFSGAWGSTTMGVSIKLYNKKWVVE